VALTWLADRSVLLPEPPPLFGWAAGLPPAVRGAETGATLVAAGAGVTPALPLPGRMSDRARPPYAGCAPVDCGNRGRNTESVLLSASSRSPRVLRAPGVFASRMLTGRICVWVAASTRDTGMPRLKTRVLLPTIVVEGVVWW
jgi:hypothetical protein